jgi:chemotaxis protein MotB
MGRKHAEHHEEHADETWLVPYADLLTLLLALFIVLFAMGKTDEKKLGEMGRSFNVAFGGGAATFMPYNQTAPQLVPMDVPPSENQIKKDIMNPSQSSVEMQAALRETVQLLQVKEAVDRYIKLQGLGGELEAQLMEDGLRIRIKDSALFASGQAELFPEARKLAGDIAKLLAGLPQQIVVAGHTDNVPINTGMFPSNWELSGMRAVNFMRFLFSIEPTLKPANFSAVGHGEYRPVQPNTSDENRAKNRRVEVWIIRSQKPPKQ